MRLRIWKPAAAVGVGRLISSPQGRGRGPREAREGEGLVADTKARALRKTMTEAEKRLWSILRNRQLAGLKFRRQHPIGPYTADFTCFEHMLVIEADGGQHDESTTDEKRTEHLRKAGWTVLRFWNTEILDNLEGVARKIVDSAER